MDEQLRTTLLPQKSYTKKVLKRFDIHSLSSRVVPIFKGENFIEGQSSQNDVERSAQDTRICFYAMMLKPALILTLILWRNVGRLKAIVHGIIGLLQKSFEIPSRANRLYAHMQAFG